MCQSLTNFDSVQRGMISLLISLGLPTRCRRLATNHTGSNISDKASRGYAYMAKVRILVSKIVKIGKK